MLVALDYFLWDHPRLVRLLEGLLVVGTVVLGGVLWSG